MVHFLYDSSSPQFAVRIAGLFILIVLPDILHWMPFFAQYCNALEDWEPLSETSKPYHYLQTPPDPNEVRIIGDHRLFDYKPSIETLGATCRSFKTCKNPNADLKC
jgi:hypothetical protein